MSIGNVASRASAGAAPEGIRKGRARVVGGHAAFFLRVSFLGWCPLALQPGGRGAWLSFRPGGVCVCVSDPLFWWGRPLSPPSVQHRPRVTYSGTAKGPLLGGLPIVSGLEGVCDVEEKETEGLNPAACYTKRLERCEGTRKQKRGMGVKREGVRLLPSSPPRPARLGVGCKRRGGCPRERESNREGSAIPPAFSLP